jgi:hypothetical protein
MLKSFKLLILLFLFASYSQGQNLQLPNMPDSFEVRRYSLDSTQIQSILNFENSENLIINLNNVINLNDYKQKWNQIIDKPQNTPVYRIGMDTNGYALKDGTWRFFSIKDNSIYYSGLEGWLGVCNTAFKNTMYLEKPVMLMPIGKNSKDYIYDTSIVNYPIFKRQNQFNFCDSAKIYGTFYSKCKNLNNGKIIIQNDTIEVFCTKDIYIDSINIFLPENGLWKFNEGKEVLNNSNIRVFVKNGPVLPLINFYKEWNELDIIFDRRMRAYTGLNQIKIDDIKLFPNPISDFLNYEGPTCNKMILYDAQGRLVWEGENVQQIQMQHLSEGIYNLSIKTDAGLLMKKIVKE